MSEQRDAAADVCPFCGDERKFGKFYGYSESTKHYCCGAKVFDSGASMRGIECDKRIIAALTAENERLRKELSCSSKAVAATDDCIAAVMRFADHLCDKMQEHHDAKIAAETEAERLRGENERLRMRLEELESAVSADDDE